VQKLTYQGAREEKGGHGSTRMHMDVADAINIMLYAANPTSGTAVDTEDSESTMEIDPTLEDPVDNADTASSSSRPTTRPKPLQPSRSLPRAPQSQTGCAVWDIYRAEDTDKIRIFLKKKFQKHKTAFTDPIHSQMFYLDAELRKELWDKMGVASFRIYQYPVSPFSSRWGMRLIS
jgi:lysine-specific demethylase 3